MAEGRRVEDSAGGDDRWTRQYREARRRQLQQHTLRMVHARSVNREHTHTPKVSDESRKIMALRRSKSAPHSRRIEAERSVRRRCWLPPKGLRPGWPSTRLLCSLSHVRLLRDG
eukprot:6037807-Prymnesium_polylepis.1